MIHLNACSLHKWSLLNFPQLISSSFLSHILTIPVPLALWSKPPKKSSGFAIFFSILNRPYRNLWEFIFCHVSLLYFTKISNIKLLLICTILKGWRFLLVSLKFYQHSPFGLSIAEKGNKVACSLAKWSWLNFPQFISFHSLSRILTIIIIQSHSLCDRNLRNPDFTIFFSTLNQDI